MKYIFLENITESNKNNGNYTHYYFYYITNNEKFNFEDFKQVQSKEKINFKLDHYKLNIGQYIISAFSNSHCPENLEQLLKNIFKYILDKGLDSKTFLRITIDDNDNIIEAE